MNDYAIVVTWKQIIRGGHGEGEWRNPFASKSVL